VATKTEDRLHHLELQLVVLQEQLADLERSHEQADLIELHKKLAVLEFSLNEVRGREQESDRRRWQFWLGVGIVVITFVANLTINLLMFFAKKPG